jgi:hypothetical protein
MKKKCVKGKRNLSTFDICLVITFVLIIHFYCKQRNKFIRKPLGSTGRVGGPSTVIPDSEYRNLSSLLETEAERNRILARNGFTSNSSTDNRPDSITPNSNQKRVLSASGQRKDNGKDLHY